MKTNPNFASLENSYLFSRVAAKVADYRRRNPDKDVISLGIGDVTLPLAAPIVEAMHGAVTEMGSADGFRGYGDEQGYLFLREAICEHYVKKGVSLDTREVFVNDGAISDLANILDIFALDTTALIPSPVYPVYVDTNLMSGRKIIYMDGNEENGFLPLPSGEKADLIYLCSPNNPTGAVYSKEQLKLWVDYANATGAVILFDSAYEIFVKDEKLPTSIYQIEGADTCAIEFCSFSKTAGFTGTRCGYTIVPHGLGNLNELWLRRQSTKFNGVSYIIQRGAEAVFTDEGMKEIKQNIAYYMENAKLISDTLTDRGIWHVGGENAPYIWLKCGMDSWQYFDHLLETANIVGMPGVGFGANGDGYFRLSAFGSKENINRAMRRI